MKHFRLILVSLIFCSYINSETVCAQVTHAEKLINLKMPPHLAKYVGDNIGDLNIKMGTSAGVIFEDELGNDLWVLEADGDLISDVTNGGDLKITAQDKSVQVLGFTSIDGDQTTVASLATTSAWFSANSGTHNVVFTSNTADGNATVLNFLKTRAAPNGTNANTIVSNGDDLGRLSFYGADGADYKEAAQILIEVDAAPGVGDMAGRIVFLTSIDGAATPTEAMRINNSQDVVLADKLTSSGSTDLGWSIVDQTDNQACNTGCTSACVAGQDLAGANKPLVGCTDTTADICLCAGAS